MPIEMLPTSRRRFLQTTAGALGAWAVFSHAEEDQPERNPNVIALLSDTHIAGDITKKQFNINMTDSFRRVKDEVLSHASRPSRVLINGDCAFLHGEPDDYRMLVQHLEGIRTRGLAIDMTLGNHDDRAEFVKQQVARDMPASDVTDRLAYVRSTEHVNWFLLDSLEVVGATPGILGDAQVDWLDQSLKAHADKPAFVMAHHNVDYHKHLKKKTNVVVDPADKRITAAGLRDDEKLLDVIKAHPHVNAYFCGHTHQWNVLKWEGIHMVNLPTTAYPFAKLDPAGWVLCTHAKDKTSLQLFASDPSHKYHQQVVEIAHESRG